MLERPGGLPERPPPSRSTTHPAKPEPETRRVERYVATFDVMVTFVIGRPGAGTAQPHAVIASTASRAWWADRSREESPMLAICCAATRAIRGRLTSGGRSPGTGRRLASFHFGGFKPWNLSKIIAIVASSSAGRLQPLSRPSPPCASVGNWLLIRRCENCASGTDRIVRRWATCCTEWPRRRPAFPLGDSKVPTPPGRDQSSDGRLPPPHLRVPAAPRAAQPLILQSFARVFTAGNHAASTCR